FGVKGLPAPTTIGPNQPFPYTGVYLSWAVLAVVTLVVGLIVFATHRPQRVLEQSFALQPLTAAEQSRVFFSEPFELRGRHNVRLDQGVPRPLHWFLALGAISAIPVLVLIYHGIFEKRRWEDST